MIQIIHQINFTTQSTSPSDLLDPVHVSAQELSSIYLYILVLTCRFKSTEFWDHDLSGLFMMLSRVACLSRIFSSILSSVLSSRLDQVSSLVGQPVWPVSKGPGSFHLSVSQAGLSARWLDRPLGRFSRHLHSFQGLGRASGAFLLTIAQFSRAKRSF